MSKDEVKFWKELIDAMSREDMCRLWRFAPSGHPCFITGTELTGYFQKKFDRLGGFSPEISKKIGLG